MREDDTNWSSRWEEQEKGLPSEDKSTALSRTLITHDLAFAFNIQNTHTHSHITQPSPPPSNPSPKHLNSGEFADSGEHNSEEPARTLKRPRLVWTPELHKKFIDAVSQLGIKNAVPKTIMQLMDIDGLTRENVASHLQKYRLYLKRMQEGEIPSTTGSGASSDPTTEHLFACGPVPPHFLHPNSRSRSSDQFLPFVSMSTTLQHQQHMAQLQQQYQRQKGNFGSPPKNESFEHAFMTRQSQTYRMGPIQHSMVPGGNVEDIESANAAGGGKFLTLYTSGDD